MSDNLADLIQYAYREKRWEYAAVLKASVDPWRLVRLHEQPASPSHVRVILDELGFDGRLKYHGDRGWSSFDGRSITLPTTSSGRLRVGCVLHEFAHTKAPYERRAGSRRGVIHGRVFTDVLDGLARWYDGWLGN